MWPIFALVLVGSLFPLHQLVEATTYTIGDPEYLRIFTKTYRQVWTEILSQGGYLVRTKSPFNCYQPGAAFPHRVRANEMGFAL